MAPRDFNTDGAAGAFGGAGGSPSSGPFTSQSFGSAMSSGNPMTAGALSSVQFNPGEINGPRTIRANTANAPSLINPASLQPMSPSGSTSSGFSGTPGSSYGGFGSSGGINASGAPGLPYAFEDGGSMPGDQGGGDDLVSLALATVDGALDYGRQKYGLGGGQQEANAIPIVPGTQSESGSRERPAPGPLPPTSNPFGKRILRPFGDAGGNTETAALMPMIPGTQSESGIPPERPQPRQSSADDNTQVGAIPDDQDEEAA